MSVFIAKPEQRVIVLTGCVQNYRLSVWLLEPSPFKILTAAEFNCLTDVWHHAEVTLKSWQLLNSQQKEQQIETKRQCSGQTQCSVLHSSSLPTGLCLVLILNLFFSSVFKPENDWPKFVFSASFTSLNLIWMLDHKRLKWLHNPGLKTSKFPCVNILWRMKDNKCIRKMYLKHKIVERKKDWSKIKQKLLQDTSKTNHRLIRDCLRTKQRLLTDVSKSNHQLITNC